jgi:hypothetical protein
LATAQSVSVVAFDPGAICHGAGQPAPGNTAAPGGERDFDAHLSICCASCIATAPFLLQHTPLAPAQIERQSDPAASVAGHGSVPIAWRAVRAGLSQAPPTAA